MGLEIQNKDRTKTYLGISPFISIVKSNCNVNFAPIYARVDGNVNGFNGTFSFAGVGGDVYGGNGAGVAARVNGDVYGGNGAGAFALVKGNVNGFNGAGVAASVGEDVHGSNGAVGYAEVNGTLEDTTLGELFPKLTKYLPKIIKETNIPAFNVGIWTETGNTDNAVIFGFYNKIEKTDGDYLVFGLVNRIKQDDGKYSTRLLVDGKITIDGIFRHKESKLEDSLESK